MVQWDDDKAAANVEKHGVDIRHFPEDVIKEMYRLSAEVVAETAAEGDLGKRIYESWSKARREAIARGPYAEQGYMNNRAL